MIDIKLKAGGISKKLLKSFKRVKELKAKKGPEPTASLPDRLHLVCSPLARKLFQREQTLNEREAAIEREAIQLQNKKADWEAEKAAEKAKQARVKKGTAILFKANRIQAQVEREQDQRAASALENGLCEATQQELDAVAIEYDRVTTAFLTATATQNIAATVSLKAKATADAVSDQLTRTIDATHRERLHLHDLTEGVKARSVELDGLISSAKDRNAHSRRLLKAAVGDRLELQELMNVVNARVAELEGLVSIAKLERAEACRHLQGAEAHAMRFDRAAEAIALIRNSVDKERDDVLNEARAESQRRLTALNDARLGFEKLRAAEKENIVRSHARVEELRAAVENEKKVIAKEREKIRILGEQAEQERAASVDAKQAALEELHASVNIRMASTRASINGKGAALGELFTAGIIRGESGQGSQQLVTIANEMATAIGRSKATITNKSSGTRIEEIDQFKDKGAGGRTSRLGFNGARGEASSTNTNSNVQAGDLGREVKRGITDSLTKKFGANSIQDSPGFRASLPFSIHSGRALTPERKDRPKAGASTNIGEENIPTTSARRIRDSKIPVSIYKESKPVAFAAGLNAITNTTTKNNATAAISKQEDRKPNAGLGQLDIKAGRTKLGAIENNT